MASTGGTPNPWAPYDSYKDCSQGVCSVYCPQWCYIIFPPPPSFFLDVEDDDSSSSDFSPFLIAIIGILACAFILLTYYTLISKYCHRRRENSSSSTSEANNRDRSISSSVNGDLNAECNHAFHVACIDTWLKSHSNCPLCRAFIAGITVATAVEAVAVSNQSISAYHIATESTGINSISTDLHHQTGDSTVVNVDLETRSRSETVPKPPELRDNVRRGRGEEEQVNRRSASQNSGTVVLVADILREIEDDLEAEDVGTSRRLEEGEGEKTPTSSGSAANQTSGISNFLVRSSMAMKRSVSAGKFVISSYDRPRNYRLPN